MLANLALFAKPVVGLLADLLSRVMGGLFTVSNNCGVNKHFIILVFVMEMQASADFLGGCFHFRGADADQNRELCSL